MISRIKCEGVVISEFVIGTAPFSLAVRSSEADHPGVRPAHQPWPVAPLFYFTLVVKCGHERTSDRYRFASRGQGSFCHAAGWRWPLSSSAVPPGGSKWMTSTIASLQGPRAPDPRPADRWDSRPRRCPPESRHLS